MIAVLTARGFEVTDQVRERVKSCEDLHTLESWLPEAVTVDRAEGIFD